MTEKEMCYNGTSASNFGQYGKSLPGTSSTVEEQLYVLTDLTDKLKKAYQGQEVEMVDDTGMTYKVNWFSFEANISDISCGQNWFIIDIQGRSNLLKY